MKIPKNMSEKEVLRIINKIATKLAYKFRFGYHGIEDMKQQAHVFAIQGMEAYDESRPLENFLWTHVRNRLFNYKRDNFERPDKPCLSCPFHDPNRQKSNSECEEFSDKSECVLYHGWVVRNSSKKNLMSPIGISEVSSAKEQTIKISNSAEDTVADNEIIALIDKNIPLDIRLDYIRFKNNLKLPKARREAVKDAIFKILEENGIDG